jgi:hypothetical protein
MASELPGYSGPKEAEEAPVQRMRMGGGGNLMARRTTGNLMSKPTTGGGNLMAAKQPEP